MHVLFTAILSDEVLQAVCWTLIHSLWQGLVAAVIAALIITLTKRSSANLRYNLLIAVLALFFVTVSITAKRELSHPKGSQDVSINANSKVNAAAALNLNPTAGLDTGSSGQENFEGFNAWCNQYASTIVSVWLLIFLIKCGQLIMGFHYLRRLRYRNNYEVDSYWKERLLQLTEKTGIRRSIAFLESELVKVPAVIGFLKPVLLVPAGLLSRLPPEQVEAILIHELAHIHRKDFLVNVLQSF